jgi:hypothetical protein
MNSEKRKFNLTLQKTARFSVFTLAKTGSTLDQESSPTSNPVQKRARIRQGIEVDAAEMTRRLESKWLSDQLVAATKGVQNIQLSSPDVVQALEPFLQKCRIARSQQLTEAEQRGAQPLSSVQSSLGSLVEEEVLHFDTALHDIRTAFSNMLFSAVLEPSSQSLGEPTEQHIAFSDGCSIDRSCADSGREDLSRLHERVHGDLGKRGARPEKRELLAPLLDAHRRKAFQDCYEKLVLEYILPHIESTIPLQSRRGVHYYQAFPCVRVVRPGEFSIGVHADCNYGFQAGNVNFYLPLTRIAGSNSLAIESAPGKEDWHFLDLDYGQIHRFHGAVCAHFTPENTTEDTRVSFDFRVVCGAVYHASESDRFSASPGYYVRAQLEEQELDTGVDVHGSLPLPLRRQKWVRCEPLPVPDYRVGFPFTSK